MAKKPPKKEELSFHYEEEEIPISRIFERELQPPKNETISDPMRAKEVLSDLKRSYEVKSDLVGPNEILSGDMRSNETISDPELNEILSDEMRPSETLSGDMGSYEVKSDLTRPNETTDIFEITADAPVKVSDQMRSYGTIPDFVRPNKTKPDLIRPNETTAPKAEKPAITPSMNDIVVLDYLKSEGAGLFNYDVISEEVGRSYFGVKKTVERLIQMGLVERLSPKHTGRSGGLILALTPAGLEYWNTNYQIAGMVMRGKS